MDLLNHDINFNFDMEYSDEKRRFIIKAIKNIDKNEILTITYGKVDNLNLFTVYGFTLKNNNIKTPIRIQIGEFKYSLYPEENENANKKGIVNLITTLKERYGKDKEKEIFICNLILNGLKDKMEKINLIKLDNFNIRNIVEEIKISISKYIYILEKDFLKITD